MVSINWKAAMRWLATPVLVISIGTIVLGAVWLGVYTLLHQFMGVETGAASWYAKVVTVPFVTCSLVATAWYIAPSKRSIAAGLALLLGCTWSGLFLVSGLLDWFVPLALMGVGGIVAGVVSFAFLRGRSTRMMWRSTSE
jgi:hypothetical protein